MPALLTGTPMLRHRSLTAAIRSRVARSVTVSAKHFACEPGVHERDGIVRPLWLRVAACSDPLLP
jgi:hypothetical protein